MNPSMAEEEPPHAYPHPHPTHHDPPKISPHPPTEKPRPPSPPPYKEPLPPPPYHRRRASAYPATVNPRRPLCTFIVIALLLLGLTALTLFLIYRPHHPNFRVISAAAFQLNTSSPPFISAAMQFTVEARNPNRRVTIYYDPLSAYVAYKNVAITPPAVLPPLFQDTKSTVALSPVIGGAPVAVEAALSNALAMDEAYGVVGMRLVITGKLRYKAAGVKSGRRGVYVACDLLVGLKRGFVGQLTLLQSPPCRVYV